MKFKATARYVPIKTFDKVDKIYNHGGKKEEIDNECQKWAVEYAAQVKASILANPEVLKPSKNWNPKQLAANSVSVVDGGVIKKRKKKYPGTDIPVSLVSSSTGGPDGGWASLAEEFGYGGKPGNYSWLKTIFKFGGIAGRKRYSR